MSITLEQNGVYLLPEGLGGQTYLILLATQETGTWHLTECHETPFGDPAFKERATFPPEEMVHFEVATNGELLERTESGVPRQTGFTLGNLSILGHLQNGTFMPAE